PAMAMDRSRAFTPRRASIIRPQRESSRWYLNATATPPRMRRRASKVSADQPRAAAHWLNALTARSRKASRCSGGSQAGMRTRWRRGARAPSPLGVLPEPAMRPPEANEIADLPGQHLEIVARDAERRQRLQDGLPAGDGVAVQGFHQPRTHVLLHGA